MGLAVSLNTSVELSRCADGGEWRALAQAAPPAAAAAAATSYIRVDAATQRDTTQKPNQQKAEFNQEKNGLNLKNTYFQQTKSCCTYIQQTIGH